MAFGEQDFAWGPGGGILYTHGYLGAYSLSLYLSSGVAIKSSSIQYRSNCYRVQRAAGVEVIGLCVFVCVCGHKNELFQRTRHFHGSTALTAN